MKPFDKERAIAGDPVVTRHGQKVEEIHYFESLAVFKFVVNGLCHTSGYDGKHYSDLTDSYLDLFMASKTLKCYINIYKMNSQSIFCGCSYDSYADAVEEICPRNNYIKTIEVTVDETD